jgi:hypothetical protein
MCCLVWSGKGLPTSQGGSCRGVWGNNGIEISGGNSKKLVENLDPVPLHLATKSPGTEPIRRCFTAYIMKRLSVC